MSIKGKYYFTLKIKNYGEIKLELDADVAPITVENFIKLVNTKNWLIQIFMMD